ncbi:MAG TPA: PDZ domain-containing protein [Polyangiaceae bacterium]|nr:PDZ domain-containing protein [Polyangiaceae bacterium]
MTAQAAPGDASAKPKPATTKTAAAATSSAAATTAAPPAAAATPPAAPSAKSTPPAAAIATTPPAPGAPPTKPEVKLPPPKTPLEAAVQGTVMLERAGRPLAVGTLLNGDGRILTALSPLTHGNQIDARYPDGHISHVRVSYADRAWDLALLTPEGDARHAGLKASRDAEPGAGTKLKTIGYLRDKLLGPTDQTVKAKGTLRGGDSAELSDALELGVTPKPNDIGAPLVNDKGEVVGVIARACSPNDKAGCTLVPYGVPVSAIRGFLRDVPMRHGPWVGLEAVAFDAGIARGVRVAAVAPDGPAANAGLHAGPPGMADVVLAVDGTPVASAEAFADAVDNHAPGAPIRLLVLSEGRYREVGIVVHEPPEAVGRHERVIQSNPWPQKPHAPIVPTAPNPYR